jgi:hypothetical protein
MNLKIVKIEKKPEMTGSSSSRSHHIHSTGKDEMGRDIDLRISRNKKH